MMGVINSSILYGANLRKLVYICIENFRVKKITLENYCWFQVMRPRDLEVLGVMKPLSP